MSELYHRDIGFPKDVRFIVGILRLRYSAHALHECDNDRYGAFEPPATIDVGTGEPVEIEVECGVVVKAVYRAQFDDELDVVIVVTPDGWVKTAWLNQRNDKHRSLDRSKYRRP